MISKTILHYKILEKFQTIEKEGFDNYKKFCEENNIEPEDIIIQRDIKKDL